MGSAIILPLVLLGVIAVFTVVFLVVTNKQKKSVNTKGKSGTSSKTSTASKSDDVRRDDVFKFMEFDKIIDNMMVQKNGARYTMAIKCKGINYDLMSDVEQMAVEEGFITFLNTLKYPIQFYVQAQNIDLKSAIAKYKSNISGIKDEYEEIDHEYTKMLERFDTTEEDLRRTEAERSKVLNVYEYASDIINYVERMSLNKNLLQRNFYVLVSYNKSEIAAGDKFSDDEKESLCYTELLTRCQGIINSLASASVEGKVLNSNELADLLYTAYNRDDKGIMNVREAIESGFYRLYSTSEDSFYKKNKLLNEQIENEARIKAIEALKDAIKNGTYSSPTTDALDVTEQISKTAVEMIKNENLPEDIKNSAKKTIIDEYKVAKKQLMDQIINEQDAILSSDTDSLAQKVEAVEKTQEVQTPKLMTIDEIATNNNTVDLSRKELINDENVTSKSNDNVDANYSNVSQMDYEHRNRIGMDYEENDSEIIGANVNNAQNDYNQNYGVNTQSSNSSSSQSANLFDDRLNNDDDDDELI